MAKAADDLSPTNHRLYKITSVINQDIAGLAERIDSILVEVLMNQSSGLEDFRDADKTRVGSYFKQLKDYKAWVIDQPEVDSPQTHPEKHPIEYLSNKETITDPETSEEHVIVQNPENKSVRDLSRMLRTLLGEMVLSASRRMPNGMTSHDANRFDMHIAKMEAFMASYVEDNQPADMPETNPSSPMTGHGYD